MSLVDGQMYCLPNGEKVTARLIEKDSSWNSKDSIERLFQSVLTAVLFCGAKRLV